MIDVESGASHDIVVCLKCGFQVKIAISILKSATQYMLHTVDEKYTGYE